PISRANSPVLYRLRGCSRWAGSSQASATTLACCRGGNGRLAAAPRLVGQAKPLGRPDPSPVAHPRLVLAKPSAGGHAVERRVGTGFAGDGRAPGPAIKYPIK